MLLRLLFRVRWLREVLEWLADGDDTSDWIARGDAGFARTLSRLDDV